jgi:hypothetical protein
MIPSNNAGWSNPFASGLSELFEIVCMEKNVAAAGGMLQKRRVSDGSSEEIVR